MNILPLLRRDSAMLTLSASLAILALLVVFAWLVLWNLHQANRRDIEDIEPRVARLLGLQQAAKTLAEQSRQADTLLVQLALPASLPTNQAATELMQRLRQIAEKSGLVMQGSQALPIVERGDHQLIPVSITAQGSIDGLVDLLANLQSVRPIIRIERLTVRPLRQRRKDGSPEQVLYFQIQASIARINS